VSNDAEGTRALFGGAFPSWDDAASLRRQVSRAIDSPDEVSRLVAELSATVRTRHTYRERASQLHRALIDHGLRAPP
jgi:hypothetical protein